MKPLAQSSWLWLLRLGRLLLIPPRVPFYLCQCQGAGEDQHLVDIALELELLMRRIALM